MALILAPQRVAHDRDHPITPPATGPPAHRGKGSKMMISYSVAAYMVERLETGTCRTLTEAEIESGILADPVAADTPEAARRMPGRLRRAMRGLAPWRLAGAAGDPA